MAAQPMRYDLCRTERGRGRVAHVNDSTQMENASNFQGVVPIPR